jgi:hypothetical protein
MFAGAETAAATAVGVDVLANESEVWRMDSAKRILVSVAIVGSTNPGDCAFDVMIGNKLVGTVMNSRGGANLYPNRDDEQYIGKFVNSGAPVQLIVRSVSVGNPIVYYFRFKPWRNIRRRRTYRRRTTKSSRRY